MSQAFGLLRRRIQALDRLVRDARASGFCRAFDSAAMPRPTVVIADAGQVHEDLDADSIEQAIGKLLDEILKARSIVRDRDHRQTARLRDSMGRGLRRAAS